MSSQIQAKKLDPIQQGASDSDPTAPSFIDRFMNLVAGLPGPYWLPYVVLFVLQSIAVHVLAWIDGWLSAYTFSPILLMFPLWLWGPLAIITYLNSISLEALSTFSPLLDVDEEGLKRLKDEFTTMPARGVIVNGVIWSIIYIILTALILETLSVSLGLGPVLTPILVLEGLVSYSTGSAIYYHSLRQLRLVSRTVKMVRQVNLFQLDPVYAFSRLTSRTGVAWMILLSLTLLTYPMQLASAPVLVVLAVQVALALAAFVLPLRFVNDRLVAEKRKLVAELDGRVERTLERLHHHLDRDDMREMEQLNDAIAALNAEREILTRIPTWPWRAGTLTSFLSAIVLPIVLFLIQLVIQNWLGG
jgi:hypothetical protein